MENYLREHQQCSIRLQADYVALDLSYTGLLGYRSQWKQGKPEVTVPQAGDWVFQLLDVVNASLLSLPRLPGLAQLKLG